MMGQTLNNTMDTAASTNPTTTVVDTNANATAHEAEAVEPKEDVPMDMLQGPLPPEEDHVEIQEACSAPPVAVTDFDSIHPSTGAAPAPAPIPAATATPPKEDKMEVEGEKEEGGPDAAAAEVCEQDDFEPLSVNDASVTVTGVPVSVPESDNANPILTEEANYHPNNGSQGNISQSDNKQSTKQEQHHFQYPDAFHATVENLQYPPDGQDPFDAEEPTNQPHLTASFDEMSTSNMSVPSQQGQSQAQTRSNSTATASSNVTATTATSSSTNQEPVPMTPDTTAVAAAGAVNGSQAQHTSSLPIRKRTNAAMDPFTPPIINLPKKKRPTNFDISTMTASSPARQHVVNGQVDGTPTSTGAGTAAAYHHPATPTQQMTGSTVTPTSDGKGVDAEVVVDVNNLDVDVTIGGNSPARNNNLTMAATLFHGPDMVMSPPPLKTTGSFPPLAASPASFCPPDSSVASSPPVRRGPRTATTADSRAIPNGTPSTSPKKSTATGARAKAGSGAATAAATKKTAKTRKRGWAKKSWEERFNELKGYITLHGNANVPTISKEYPSLGHWVHDQRKQYRLHERKRSTTMNQDRIDKLESVGFQWALQKHSTMKTWDARLVELKEYKEKNGHSNVPIRWQENPSLGQWVSTQRQEYSSFQSGRKSNMTQARISALDEIGFVWSLRDTSKMAPRKTWDMHFHALEDFKARYGHCDVRVRSKQQPSGSLGRWVEKQRSQYVLWKDGKSSRLSAEQVKRLESIGFKWRIRSDKIDMQKTDVETKKMDVDATSV